MVGIPHRVRFRRVSMDHSLGCYGQAASLGYIRLGTWSNLGEHSDSLVSRARVAQAHAVADRARGVVAHTLGQAATQAGTGS